MASALAIAEQLARDRRSIYLGQHRNSALFAESRESVVLLGAPGSGKSSIIVSPSVACHPGLVIVTTLRSQNSPMPDVRDVSLRARREIAHATGGHVLEWVLDDALPTRAERCWWDMVPGCAKWDTALDRAKALAGAIPASEDNAEYWRRSAVNLVAPVLCAADLGSPRWGDREVIAKIESAAHTSANGQGPLEDVAEYLEAHLGVGHVAARRLRNFFSDEQTSPETRANVLNVVSAQIFGLFDYDQPEECRQLDVSELLYGWSTLYITLREERAEAVAPLVAAFVEALTGLWRTTEIAGRPPTLLLALDEVANVAPVRTLPQLMATGGGDGIQCLLGFQDTSQARTQWGTAGDTVINAASYRVVLPGLTDLPYLERLSRLLPHEVQPQREVSVVKDCPAGGRYADSNRLIRERTQLERALDGVHPMRRPGAETRIASTLRVARLRDGVAPRVDSESGAALDVLAELRRYTRVEERPVRRSVQEPTDLARGRPGQILIETGGSARYVDAMGWWKDPLWNSLLGSGPTAQVADAPGAEIVVRATKPAEPQP